MIRPTKYRFLNSSGDEVRDPLTSEEDDNEARGYAAQDPLITRVTALREDLDNSTEREVPLSGQP